MGSTAAHALLLAEIGATRDGQRSGAVDLTWDGVEASIYFVFGQPSHATFVGVDGTTLGGDAALDRLLADLPDDAAVSPWRRVMIPEDTLRCSVDDLAARCSGDGEGGHAAVPHPPALLVPFGVDTFPLLPLGTSLWSDAAANVVHLDMLAPKLPDSLILLTATGRRAAAVIAHGTILDAVWVDGTSGLLGDDAARALMNTTEGTVSGYALDDERLLTAIPLLWRAPRPVTDLHAEWLDVDRMLADLRAEGRSCALLVDGAVTGAVLVWEGDLVATYTDQRRDPSGSVSALRSLLRTPGARVTVVADIENRPFERRLGEEAFHLFIDPDSIATGFTPGIVDDEIAEHSTDSAPPDAAASAAIVPDMGTPPGAASDGEPLPPPPPPGWLTAFSPVDDAAADETGDPAQFAAGQYDSVPAAATADGDGDVGDDGGYVPTRLAFDVDALRSELIDIATVWLGADDIAPVVDLVTRARPGVDEFVATIATIGALPIPGHESAVVRAMAREMHFRAAEVLCGV